MKKFTTLVAIDFSKSSYVVLEKALDFTNKRDGELHVVHVVESSFFSKKEDIDAVHERRYTELSKNYSEIKKENFHCVSGKIKVEVANSAKLLDADLIIMGNSGETHFLNEFIMGSHTKEIIKNAQTPILVMKDEHELEYKNILVLTDLSDDSAAAIKKVANFFPNSKITLLNLFYLPSDDKFGLFGFEEDDLEKYQARIKDESQKNIDAFLKSLSMPNELDISASAIVSSLNPKKFKEEASDISYDMLSIHATQNVSFFAFDILEQSDVDVFVVK
ncbi:universal stress protein [Sulfurimonas crateris]|nr:universal stress protein [Sulfurimonas crateris]